MRPLIRTIPVLMALAFNAVAGNVGAQPLGTFHWQQLPYCNVLTVNVVQSGGVFHLDGTDDQCGVPVLAAVVGLAFQNPDGTIGLGMTIVTAPGATPLHLDATVSLPSASGTWRDGSGATGSFVLTPGPSAGGSARPVPRTAFPGGLSVGGTTITNVAAPVAGTDAANKAYVDVADAASRAALVNAKVWSAYVGSGGAKNSPAGTPQRGPARAPIRSSSI